MPTYAEQPFVRIAPELHAILKESAARAGESMAAHLDSLLRAALIPKPDPWEVRYAALVAEIQALREGVAAQIRTVAISPEPAQPAPAQPAEIAPTVKPAESLKDYIRKMRG